jgi:1A family penicillin-binding protein
MKRYMTRNVAIGAGALVAVLVVTAFVLWQRCGIHGCPDVERLRGYMPDEASVVLDRNGEELGKLFVTRRTVVPLDSLPETVPNAFIAIEDQRFWSHGGVDWRRVAGAMMQNVRRGGVTEGSSTITMQLARNVFPDQLPASQRTMTRKLAEARVARQIEGRYSKQDIMELYLNQIYFGSGAWGIEAAAQEYFGKPAAELNLAEAATLAALPRAPSRLNPRVNAERSQEERRLVLRLMAEQGMITAEERDEAADVQLALRKGDPDDETRAAYFIEAVRRQLEDQLGDVLYTGGYRIHTTLDMKAQQAAESELTRQLDAIESGRYGRFTRPTYAGVHADTTANLTDGVPYLQGAVVVMDARTGDVIALVGGRDFRDSQYNRATQARRQPGSAFKPFVFAAALGSGYSPAHQVLDQPLRWELGRGQVWEPRNYDGSYSGPITVREALVRSKNVATVRIANGVGIQRVIRTAEQMGLRDLPSNPSMVLGTAEVTPLELTAAFTPFATLGNRSEPRFVTRVADRHGRTVWAQQPSSRRVLDPAVAYVTTNIMEDVVSRGTGTAVRSVGFRGPAAGKTGTTQDAADVWFVGVTPEYVATVWLGFDRRQTVLRGATGGELAAPIWGRVMQQVATSGVAWQMPAGVEQRSVMSDGTLVALGCPDGGSTRQEVFVRGTVPAGSCSPQSSTYVWGDTLGGYNYDPETVRDRDDDRWWERMRQRVFGRDSIPQLPPTVAAERAPDTPQPGDRPRVQADSAAAPRPATTRPTGYVPTDTAGRGTQTRPRSEPRLLGRPADSVPPRPPPPDTSAAGPGVTDSGAGR